MRSDGLNETSTSLERVTTPLAISFKNQKFNFKNNNIMLLPNTAAVERTNVLCRHVYIEVLKSIYTPASTPQAGSPFLLFFKDTAVDLRHDKGALYPCTFVAHRRAHSKDYGHGLDIGSSECTSVALRMSTRSSQ